MTIDNIKNVTEITLQIAMTAFATVASLLVIVMVIDIIRSFRR